MKISRTFQSPQEEVTEIMDGTLSSSESELEMSPNGFSDGGKRERTLFIVTKNDGRVYENSYQYRCFHDEFSNPLWTVFYEGKLIKEAFEAYEEDFETELEDKEYWQDGALRDSRRGCYVIAEKIGRRTVLFSWS